MRVLTALSVILLGSVPALAHQCPPGMVHGGVGHQCVCPTLEFSDGKLVRKGETGMCFSLAPSDDEQLTGPPMSIVPLPTPKPTHQTQI